MLPSDLRNKKILYACLDWGKGHVARSIGVIRQLLAQSNEVVIAGNEEQCAIFRCYFPDATYLHIEGYDFRFSGTGSFAKDLWRMRKSFLQKIRSEAAWIDAQLEGQNIDLIISDHRYGFRSQKVTSIFLTHQLNLALKRWQWPVQRFHHRLLRDFNLIWVLDQPDSRLAGKLSANTSRFNAKYIGFYSRFVPRSSEKRGEVVICNGPAPYDEYLFLQHMRDLNKEKTIIGPARLVQQYPEASFVVADDWKRCDELISKAKKIYAYCGYTTLMDLQILDCEAQLRPTKGQTEQEYLYHLHIARKG